MHVCRHVHGGQWLSFSLECVVAFLPADDIYYILDLFTFGLIKVGGGSFSQASHTCHKDCREATCQLGVQTQKPYLVVPYCFTGGLQAFCVEYIHSGSYVWRPGFSQPICQSLCYRMLQALQYYYCQWLPQFRIHAWLSHYCLTIMTIMQFSVGQDMVYCPPLLLMVFVCQLALLMQVHMRDGRHNSTGRSVRHVYQVANH